MRPMILQPNFRYLTKMRLIITITALLFLLSGAVMVWLITRETSPYENDTALIYAGVIVLNLAWAVPALLLTGPYYRSLSYEIQDDEVIVRAGILTHSVKHVPYRTVTNLTIQRGILDRWFYSLGSLHVQTAGMSGTAGAEEVLAGLSDVNDVYGIIVRELQRFRGAMGPAGAEVAGAADAFGADGSPSAEVLSAILTEVQAIRRSVEAR